MSRPHVSPEPTRLMDDSLEAIHARNEQSIVWEPGSVPAEVGDHLWRAVRDRRFLLLALADALRVKP